jgi:Uma2 family endonuclease
VATANLPAAQSLVLGDVDWLTYTRLLRVFADRPSVRLTYDRGVLEIMSPLPQHEGEAYLLGRFVDTLTDELNLAVIAGRSTTFRRRRQRRGLEADNSYWIASVGRVRGKDRIDLRVDPPPDLAIEVDVTHSSLDRMAIYATLGIPEVWRFAEGQLTFQLLQGNKTYASGTSRSFPGLEAVDVLPFLNLRKQADDTEVVRQFRAWVRARIAAGWSIPAPPP